MRVDKRNFLSGWPVQGVGLKFRALLGEFRLSKRLFLGVWTHFSPDLCRRNWRIDQVPHSDEVVSGGRKGEHPSDLVHTAMSGLAQHSDCLQPAEYFLDPFPPDLTDFVSGVSRRAPIDGAAAPTFVILRHMRRDVHASDLAHELFACRSPCRQPPSRAGCPQSARPSAAPRPVPLCHWPAATPRPPPEPFRFSISTLPQ